MFQYITFRSACAIILSLIISMVFGKKVIRMLQKQQIGEEIRDLGLAGQMEKNWEALAAYAYLEFDGEGVSAEKLEKAWNAVQKHHPMLRARFLENGQQEIMDVPYKDNIEVKDLRDCQDFENIWKRLERKCHIED